ncbi:AMP-binding protein [Novosphingobium sp. MMS21-SN21R]|uniref:AMP-binding protein n=1 Tax=Novosphingobium sp. MMS21-SN21R TaxID=2969298 RepID=UPI002884B537|nr:AMP-binding protein [Novosphingobium sp. MMS21-SN21R]MDT0509817.1 AMP-binding protein [Novosphingobium sp. MMS21-SN21R]
MADTNWTLRTDPSGFQTRWSQPLADRYLAEGHWTNTTLVDAARKSLLADPDHLLLIEGDVRLTRRECWDKALKLAAFFLSRGLKPGDVISFQLPNWVESAVIALAARMTGLVINPIPPIYRESELAYILADCRSKLIFVPGTFRKHDHAGMLAGLQADLPELRDIVVVRDGGPLTWDMALAHDAADEAALPKVNPSAVMMVMYTSGTTGKPKGVLHTHYSYDHRARAMGDAWKIGPEDVVFMPSPVTHITGALWAFDLTWIHGSASVLMDVWTVEEGIRVIEEHHCTVNGGATPFLQQLLDTASSRPEAIASLRLFFCGGTTVSPDLIRKASETFPNCLFFRCYGSTEMVTATLGIREREQAELGADTDGEIVYPAELKIIDAVDDTPLPHGQEGEIIARGPGLFFGYVHPADNEGNFIGDGYFRMGDLGCIVHDDYIVITGRKKDIIIRSGENISPKEVEDVLFNHPAVAEVAIVAMPSAATGEKGCAFIIPRDGQTIDLPEIRRFLDEQGLARQKFPEHVVLVDDLPRVPSGKVKKDVLRVMAKAIADQAVA